ncbi:hypothetical protein PAAG_06415 [Paracoccidioides lutzii Pb01]|uniref:Uncharacterized protein n=1 Tax=Paracoccidioides lutzii (strain ATCC MYA-826 / Pb01) TaxID=502779 RepID=C1H6M4_PARBA|nr:hypothetical protein PAAG_06415 [Paracoccidioides lutzii Pb01]EEH35368.2 hypothetical protein PAAG_06415 [Paracoccidioides lutzii Pb01]
MYWTSALKASSGTVLDRVLHLSSLDLPLLDGNADDVVAHWFQFNTGSAFKTDPNDPEIRQQSQERKSIYVDVIQNSPNMDFSVTGVYALIRYLKSTDHSLNVTTGWQDYGQTDEDDWHYQTLLGLESLLVQRIS